jgi:hypothetical protein
VRADDAAAAAAAAAALAEAPCTKTIRLTDAEDGVGDAWPSPAALAAAALRWKSACRKWVGDAAAAAA